MELSRQMSSCKDLVVEPSQLGSLKGLNGTKDTKVILVRPLTVKVKAYVQFEVFTWGFDDQGAKPLCLAIDLMLLVLNRRRVVPLYRKVNAQRFSESRPAHKLCPAWTLNYSCLTLQVMPQRRFTTTGLKPPLGLRPITKPPSLTCPWASE